jgi:hypothetical protein
LYTFSKPFGTGVGNFRWIMRKRIKGIILAIKFVNNVLGE